MTRHLRLECGMPPQFQCPHCDFQSTRKGSINAHIAIKHDCSVNSDTTWGSLDSSIPNAEFDISLFKEFLNDPSMSIVKVNPSTNKNEYWCPKCSKVYKSPYTLLRHLNFECGKERKFQCPHCSYRTHRKDNIKSHIIAKHDESQRIKCDYCTKKFVHKFRLLEHIRLFHNDDYTTLDPMYMHTEVTTHIEDNPPSPKINKMSTVTSLVTQYGYSSAPLSSTPKRPRGRPRKNKVTSSSTTVSEPVENLPLDPSSQNRDVTSESRRKKLELRFTQTSSFKQEGPTTLLEPNPLESESSLPEKTPVDPLSISEDIKQEDSLDINDSEGTISTKEYQSF